MALVQSVNDSRRAWRNFFDSATGKRKGRQGGPAAHEIPEGSPAVVSAHPQRIQRAARMAGCLWRRSARCGCAGRASCPSQPSSVTIIREPDGHYYASFVVDVAASPLPAVDREAGVDVGIARLATIATSDGARVDVANPKHLGRKLRKLRRLEREKSRRQKGSANRDKTRRKVAIAHNEVARARRDYHHKQALALVRENQVIHVEDLNTDHETRGFPPIKPIDAPPEMARFMAAMRQAAGHRGVHRTRRRRCGPTGRAHRRPRAQQLEVHRRRRASRPPAARLTCPASAILWCRRGPSPSTGPTA